MRVSKKQRDILITIIIFLLALTVRAIDLGLFLTTDEPESWLGRSMAFMLAMLEGRPGDTFFHYSPGVTLMWSGAIGLFLAYLADAGQAADFAEFLRTLPFDPIAPAVIFWFRLPNVIVGAVCIALSYLLAKNVTGTMIALIGALLLTFDPLFIGMNRVLGHDGLAASLMMLAALAAIRFFTQRATAGYWLLALSAVSAGLAILAKSTAFYIIPFVLFTAVVSAIFQPRQDRLKVNLRPTLAWSAGVILTMFLFWPALWVDPLGTGLNMVAGLQAAASQPHNRGSFFWGQPVPDPGVWFYWTATYFRLTAVTTIGLSLGLIYFAANSKRFFVVATQRLRFPEPESRAAGAWRNASTGSLLVLFLLLSFIIFYLIFLSFGSKKQDRYIVPVLPMVSLVAAWGYVWIAGKLRHGYWQNAFLAAVVTLQAVITFNSAPYYLSHYNLLAGGNSTAAETLLVGWGEGLDQAARYLNAMPDAESIKVSSWYHSTFEPYFSGQAVETAGNEKISRSAKPALVSSYVVLYINQIQRLMPTPGMIQYFQSFTPEHVITIDGIDYAFIYPSPAIKHAFSGEVRLVGQAELLGYDLLDAGGQSMTELPADRTAIIQLYWEWQGKSQEEPIMLSLVDAAGRTWGLVEFLGSYAPVPAEEWLEGAIVRADFRLRPVPGTPPGIYFLKAWIDRPDTGERVGDFPLLFEDAQITITRPADPPSVADLPLAATIDRMAADGIKLVGPGRSEQLNESWQPGETREVALYWQAEQNLARDYPATLALIDGAGLTRASWFGQPGGAHFPPTAWRPGDLIRDPWDLTLPPYVPPGDYRLTVALDDGDPITLQRLSVAGRPRQFELPPLDLPTNAAYGDSIDLLGLQAATGSGSVIPGVTGQPLTLGLVWQAVNLVDRDYVVTVQLLDGQQQVLAQRDNVPLAGAAPTTSWAAGEVLVDRISLDIPPDVGAGPHQLLIALYHLETGERLRLPNGADHLTIPVVISP